VGVEGQKLLHGTGPGGWESRSLLSLDGSRFSGRRQPRCKEVAAVPTLRFSHRHESLAFAPIRPRCLCLPREQRFFHSVRICSLLFSRHGNKCCPGLAFKSNGMLQASANHRHLLPAGTAGRGERRPRGSSVLRGSLPLPQRFLPAPAQPQTPVCWAPHRRSPALGEGGVYVVPTALVVQTVLFPGWELHS